MFRARKMLTALVALVALSVAGTAHATHTQTALLDSTQIGDWTSFGWARVTTSGSTLQGTSIDILGRTRQGACTYVEVSVSPLFQTPVRRKLVQTCAPIGQPANFSLENHWLSWEGNAFYISARFCQVRTAPYTSDKCTSPARFYMN